jgi:hypothetical protein
MTSPAILDEKLLNQLLQREDILALIGITGQLIELDYDDDVRVVIVWAQRFLNARNPRAKVGDFFHNTALSKRVEEYIQASLPPYLLTDSEVSR